MYKAGMRRTGDYYKIKEDSCIKKFGLWYESR